MMLALEQTSWIGNRQASYEIYFNNGVESTTSGTPTSHTNLVAVSRAEYSRLQLLPPRPLALVTRPVTPIQQVNEDPGASNVVENRYDDDDTTAAPAGINTSRVPTLLGDDDYMDEDWTVSTMATTGTSSVSDGGVGNGEWGDDVVPVCDSSAPPPPLAIVTFVKVAENATGSMENKNDDVDWLDNEESVNEH